MIIPTNIYLHADMSHKQRAIDRTKPLAAKPGRYRPPDVSSPSWRPCDYADNFGSLTPGEQRLRVKVGITQRSWRPARARAKGR
jgi:hypothetical protein